MTRGVRQIVRFNWPFYVGASVTLAVAVVAIGRLPLGDGVRALLYAATALPALWIVSSLTAAWVVYDLSPLTRWEWLDQALGFTPDAWINIHAGLDESTMALRALFGKAQWRVFDIFDPVEMTDRSLHGKKQIERRIVAELADGGRKIASAGGDGSFHQPVGMRAGKVDQGFCRLLGDPERGKARRGRDDLAIGADHRHMRVGIIKSLQHLGRRCAGREWLCRDRH